jgi:hypothetical protein
MRTLIERGVRFAILSLCTLATAQQSQLASLSKTLLSLRQYAALHSPVRGGLSEVTTAKHQLRDWIESRLASFPENGDEGALASEFLDAMGKAKLFCDDPAECVSNALGFLDQVQITRERAFLVVTTAVGTGIRCGYDYSAYVYAWELNRWQRVWENEQNDYAEGAYHPQTLHSVHISGPTSDGMHLILTLGTPAGCTGAFVPLYYRLWRIGARGAEASPILDKSETLNDESEPPAIAKLTADDLLIEFSAGGTGYGETHKALRHYEIHGEKATQTDPIAPTPRDFVEEWLAASWQDSASRSNSPALSQWHARLHRDDGQGDYPEPALACAADPALVEIATHLEGLPEHYFLVRTKQSLRFSMADVGDHAFPDCTRPDPAADAEPSLIPANR